MGQIRAVVQGMVRRLCRGAVCGDHCPQQCCERTRPQGAGGSLRPLLLLLLGQFGDRAADGCADPGEEGADARSPKDQAAAAAAYLMADRVGPGRRLEQRRGPGGGASYGPWSGWRAHEAPPCCRGGEERLGRRWDRGQPEVVVGVGVAPARCLRSTSAPRRHPQQVRFHAGYKALVVEGDDVALSLG